MSQFSEHSHPRGGDGKFAAKSAPEQNADADLSGNPTLVVATPDTLNSMVEFDCPFTINADGTFSDRVEGVYSPEVYHVEGAQAPGDVEVGSDEWETWSDGCTGQYGYNGAVMHASERLAGGMARQMLDEPGTYVVCAVECDPTEDDPDPFPAGWIVLRHK